MSICLAIKIIAKPKGYTELEIKQAINVIANGLMPLG